VKIIALSALKTWSAALAGLFMILVGSFIASNIIIPQFDLTSQVIELPSSWQVPAVLINAIVFGPRPAVVAAVAYIIIGLFYLPVFHGGGSLGYLLVPEFGYLAGFIPAAWMTGNLIRRKEKNNLIQIIKAAIIGLFIIHLSGVINIFIGTVFSRWPNGILDLIYSYSIAPFPSQLILCTAIGLIAKALRIILVL
tara:strand:+ start:185 stop:769 length:585 start_codon:yes stop_codon:yes gene_type:complete